MSAVGAMCDHPTCTRRSTHYISGGPVRIDIHACDEHLAALRPLVPHAGENMSPTKRVLIDVLSITAGQQINLDIPAADLREAHRAELNVARAVLAVLTEQPNTRELLLRYLEETQ